MRSHLRPLALVALAALVLLLTLTVAVEIASGASLGDIGLSIIGWCCAVLIAADMATGKRQKRG